jgi:antitoxin (DNA-binding transcriptional repressor) of toxin-antitoxin stability system
MVSDITATEAARNLSEYLNRVAYRGERFIIRRGSKSLAELSPLKAPIRGAELLALFERLPRFDPEEIAAFEADIEAARSALPITTETPWST